MIQFSRQVAEVLVNLHRVRPAFIETPQFERKAREVLLDAPGHFDKRRAGRQPPGVGAELAAAGLPGNGGLPQTSTRYAGVAAVAVRPIASAYFR